MSSPYKPIPMTFGPVSTYKKRGEVDAGLTILVLGAIHNTIPRGLKFGWAVDAANVVINAAATELADEQMQEYHDGYTGIFQPWIDDAVGKDKAKDN